MRYFIDTSREILQGTGGRQYLNILIQDQD
jgi:hypothetical protein